MFRAVIIIPWQYYGIMKNLGEENFELKKIIFV